MHRNEKPKSADKQQEKIRVIIFEGLRTDAFLVMKTLSLTPRPLYHWKAEDLSFLHVLSSTLGCQTGQFLSYTVQKVDVSLEANGCQIFGYGSIKRYMLAAIQMYAQYAYCTVQYAYCFNFCALWFQNLYPFYLEEKYPYCTNPILSSQKLIFMEKPILGQTRSNTHYLQGYYSFTG